ADARSVRVFVDVDRLLPMRAPQVGPANVERLAPRIPPLRDPARRRFDRPGTSLRPLGIGRNPLADPTSVGGRLVPAHANHRPPLFVRSMMSFNPEPWTGPPRQIGKVQ